MMPKNSDKFGVMYDRLPTGPGVPTASLTGFPFATIESRKPVEKQLRDFMTFCRRDAQSVNVKILKAEWGEGKTDAYERYIHPEAEKNGDACYFVSTSTIADRISKFHDVFSTTSYVPSSKFLASVLVSIIDEAIHQQITINGFPNVLDFQNEPFKFIEKTLENHRKIGSKKIFIFIDEFEELLIHESKVQKEIISGLKELINGQLRLVHEGGTYQGMLHFFIACTPYAYIRIMEDVDLAQITGAVKSRLTTLSLPEVTHKESLQFLTDLTRYSYNGKMPEVFPFRSLGPINSIFAISHGNLREMIKLFVKLMSTAADEKTRQFRVIDAQHFLSSLKDEDISVYGATGKAIDDELINRVSITLKRTSRGEECLAVLNLLLGEYQPFSIDEIGKRLGVPKDEIHQLVSAINIELKKIGIERAVSALFPLAKGRTFEAVKNRLQIIQDRIIIGNAKIPLKKFEEKLFAYTLREDGSLLETPLLPKEPRDLELLFESITGEDIGELTSEESEKLHYTIKEDFDQTATKRYYTLSPEIINQVFPSPLWLLMDFVKDRAKRMDLWRKASKEYFESIKELRTGILNLIEHLGIGKFETKETDGATQYKLNYKLQDKTIPISAYVYISSGNVTDQDVEEICDNVKSRRPNLVILAYSGEIESSLPTEVDGIETPILQIHIRKIRALQLIVAQLARSRAEIDQGILGKRLSEISDEAEIQKKFIDWYNKCRDSGIVIDDPYTNYADSGSKLGGILKYYINFLGSRKTSQEVFENYEDTLKNIKFFGDKEVPFAPVDIETSGEFVKFEDELVRNGFLSRQSSGIVYVENTFVERRILSIVEKYPRTHFEWLKQFFINAAQAENVLERVYLPILIHKGLITTDKDTIVKRELQSLLRELTKDFDSYDKNMKNKSETWRSFAHICVSKGRKEEKGMLIIDLNHVDQLLREKKKEIEDGLDENLLLQKIQLFKIILDYYYEKLEPKVDTAVMAVNQLRKEIGDGIESAKNSLNKILEVYNSYCQDKIYSLEEIEEYSKLSGFIVELNNIYERAFTIDELNKYRNQVKWEEYHFGRQPKEAHYFNLKYAMLEKSIHESESTINSVNNICRETQESISRTEDLKKQIHKESSVFNIPTDYKITSKIFDELHKYQAKPAYAQSALPKIRAAIIKEFFSSLEKQLGRDQSRVQGVLEKAEEIRKSEKAYLESEIQAREKSARIFFQASYDEEFTNAETFLSRATAEYMELLNQTKDKSVKSLDDLYQLADFSGKRLKNSINEKMIQAENIVDGVFEQADRILEKLQNEVESFTRVLKNAFGEKVAPICKEYVERFEVEIRITQGAMQTVKKGQETEYTWVERQKELGEVREKLFIDLKPIMPPQEGTILLEIVRIISENQSSWINVQDLVFQLKVRLKKDTEEVEQTLKKLVDLNLVRTGASLPI
jgi:hypothetical protein